MIPISEDLFRVAYEELGGKADTEPVALFYRAQLLYISWRDELIESWMEAIYGKHGIALLTHTETLMRVVKQLDEVYYAQTVTSDMWGEGEETALLVAHVTAVIRWYSNVRAGRLSESLPATVEDAAEWLKKHSIAPVKAGQLSLFLDI